MSTISLIVAVNKVCAGLIAKGFRVTNHKTADETGGMYESVRLDGTNVAIQFSIDFREGGLDCGVGRIIDRRLVIDRSRGGYWQSLFGYLMEKQGLRSTLNIRGVKPGDQESLEVGLRDYLEVIHNRCKSLEDDSILAFK